MKKITNFVTKNKFNIAVLVLYLIITIFALAHHEIWRDEAQAWCIVRDLSIFDIIKSARIEGHPILWYLLLMPFAKMGFSVVSMQILSLFLVFCSVNLIIFKFSFNPLEKILLIFNAGMLYYLPVIARNYSIIPVILFLIAVIHPERMKHPYIYAVLIVLLSQTHSYMLGLAGILFVFFFIETINDYFRNKNIKTFIPQIILLADFILIFICLYSSFQLNYALETRDVNIIPFCDLIVFISQVWAYSIVNSSDFLIKNAVLVSVISFVPFVTAVMFFIFKQSIKTGVICLFSISFILYAFSNIYFNGILYQKLFLIPLILIFCCMLIQKENKGKDKLLGISIGLLMFVSVLVSPIEIKNEIKYNFSGGKQTAEYIKHNLNSENEFIALGNPYLYSSISAYLPDKKLYSPISESYISYYSFGQYKTDEETKKIPFPENVQYFILDEKIEKFEDAGLNVIFKSNNKNLSAKTEREVFKICKKGDN